MKLAVGQLWELFHERMFSIAIVIDARNETTTCFVRIDDGKLIICNNQQQLYQRLV